ncbi:hypothetical protein ACPOLB_13715 [Rubrivivax sp. RP6-9]|uniref:hypothetical protein n=1 Tax=Rubrivivax sp. RP6-9 TaxID=3415750 RepID=UPI003CC5639E
MGRLATEFRRLYLPAHGPADTPPRSGDLVDARGRVRALVLEVARPADWPPLAAVWAGVQGDLGLPAPAIAVNGRDGLQLWFSLAEPVDVAPAQAFLEGLRRRYLHDLPAARVGLLPAVDAATAAAALRLAPPVPAPQADTGCWSAFVAQDLAPLFAETPWLDTPPGDDGQASLLMRLQSIPPALFDAVLAHLQPSAPAAPVAPPRLPDLPDLPQTAAAVADVRGSDAAQGAHAEARRFLLSVMHDPSAPLALRIEAAKALLPERPAR